MAASAAFSYTAEDLARYADIPREVVAMPETTVAVVQTKAGYRGQIIRYTQDRLRNTEPVNLEILWESKPKRTAEAARKAATRKAERALSRLFE